MNLSHATDEQLWVIIANDLDVPQHLLKPVVYEAIERGLLVKYIVGVVKKYFKSIRNATKELRRDLDDIIQLGYETTLQAVEKFVPGKGWFTHFLSLVLRQAFHEEIRKRDLQKNQGIVTSYHKELDDENTFEYFLVDNHTNVEKTVIEKVMLEDRLNLLTDEQKETFALFYKGYTYQEIAELKGLKGKSAIGRRMDKILYTMSGRKINLREIGWVAKLPKKERVS